MAPRRFVDASTEELGKRGWPGGVDNYPLHGIHFRLWLLLSVTRCGKAVVRSLAACFIIQIEFACCSLVPSFHRSLVDDRLKPAPC